MKKIAIDCGDCANLEAVRKYLIDAGFSDNQLYVAFPKDESHKTVMVFDLGKSVWHEPVVHGLATIPA